MPVYIKKTVKVIINIALLYCFCVICAAIIIPCFVMP